MAAIQRNLLSKYKYICIVVSASVLIFISTSIRAQTFFSEFDPDPNAREACYDIRTVGDTTIMLGLIRNLDYATIFKSYLDVNGIPIRTDTYDDIQGYPIEMNVSGDSILFINRNVSPDFHDLTIDVLDKDFRYKHSHTIPLLDSIVELFNLSSTLVHDGHLVLSGYCIRSGELLGIIIWVDLQTLAVVHTEYADSGHIMIGKLVSCGDQLYGSLANRNISLDDCGSCFDFAEYNLMLFDKDSPMSFVTTIGTGTTYDDYEIELYSAGKYIMMAHSLKTNQNPGLDAIIGFNTESLEYEYEIDSFQIFNSSSRGAFFRRLDDSSFLHIKHQSTSDDTGSSRDSREVMISKVSNDGKVAWTKKFDRYSPDGSEFFDFLFKAHSDGDYIWLSGNKFGDSIRHIMYKITQDGCLTDECETIQVPGYRPKPTNLVSPRNVWHIHNTDTDERYRYTFIHQSINTIGGHLMRSDEMHGNNWYSVGRKFFSNKGYVVEIFNVASVFEIYRYTLNVNQSIDLRHWSEKLRTTAIDTIEYLDGRRVPMLTLECLIEDEIADHIEPSVWIEYLGEPDHFLDTNNACSERTNEVVTCFYSAGELMWVNPRATDCGSVSTKDFHETKKNLYSISPNPSNNHISINVEMDRYIIINALGQIVTQGNQYKSGERIDISSFENGNYYIYTIDPKNRIVLSFTKI